MLTGQFAWTPSPETIADANLTRFIAACGRRDYDDLLAWSIAEPEAFYRSLLEAHRLSLPGAVQRGHGCVARHRADALVRRRPHQRRAELPRQMG